MFAPRREHARFCSPRCRVSWNRQRAGEPSAYATAADALDWSITAMRETTDRLQQAAGWDKPHALAAITEAVWWVTMVDATLVRYHAETYGRVLAAEDPAQRKVIEDTFAGLRFVRNRMGHKSEIEDFIQRHRQPGSQGAASGRIAAWTWRPVRKPALAALPPGGQEWEMTRYLAYRAQLADQTIGATFSRTVDFLLLAREASASRAP
jgi:acid phosphatase family membrane protein YuiD